MNKRRADGRGLSPQFYRRRSHDYGSSFYAGKTKELAEPQSFSDTASCQTGQKKNGAPEKRFILPPVHVPSEG
ncbi:hypothetical protein ACTHRH_18105 [Paenibacillus sp. SAFN-117]|uniref:hypothetical protein n=1 Tax=Paenibacillus sp. 32O-W TaxID=1695218 RepID=UPI001C92F63F|nr:hypothetical protein [Paenibacillus sp. 32O-W]